MLPSSDVELGGLPTEDGGDEGIRAEDVEVEEPTVPFTKTINGNTDVFVGAASRPASIRPPRGTLLGAAAVAVLPFCTYSTADDDEDGDASTKSCSGVADADASTRTWSGRADASRGIFVVPMTLDVACVIAEGVDPV